jgi:hypothetical protein
MAMSPAVYHYFKGAPEPEEIRFIVPNMGSAGAGGPPASISPDGRWVVRSQGGANLGLDAVLLNSVTHQALVRDNVVTQPFWSPDSRSIGFLEDGKLKVAEVAGGPARIVSDWPAPIGGGTWNGRRRDPCFQWRINTARDGCRRAVDSNHPRWMLQKRKRSIWRRFS